MTTATGNPIELDECPTGHAPVVHTFDHRQPVIVPSAEIRAGDFLRDLGRLRRVEHVSITDDTISPNRVVSVAFEDGIDGRYGTLSVREAIPVTVWRYPPRRACGAVPEDLSHAET